MLRICVDSRSVFYLCTQPYKMWWRGYDHSAIWTNTWRFYEFTLHYFSSETQIASVWRNQKDARTHLKCVVCCVLSMTGACWGLRRRITYVSLPCLEWWRHHMSLSPTIPMNDCQPRHPPACTTARPDTEKIKHCTEVIKINKAWSFPYPKTRVLWGQVLPS